MRWQRSRSAGGYFGWLFTGSFFLSESCLLRLELFATETVKGGKDHEKQLKQLKRLKARDLLSLHFLGKDSANPTHCPFFFFFVLSWFLMSSGRKQHTSGIFLKLQGEEGKKNIFESPDAEYPASAGLGLACAQSGPGLWAHFLPRAYTVIAFLAFFFSFSFFLAKPPQPIASAYSRRITACLCQRTGLAGGGQRKRSRERGDVAECSSG